MSGLLVPSVAHITPRPGFELLGEIVASVDVLTLLAGAGWSVGDVIARHLINRHEEPWETDLELPHGAFVFVRTDPAIGMIPRRTNLTINGEELLPSTRRVAAAVSFRFLEGASRSELERSKGRRIVLDRFSRPMKEA